MQISLLQSIPMTEVGIKCPLVNLQVFIGNLPCFTISNFLLLVSGNIIMTGEPLHTTSKERMAPELMFSSEHVPQLSITKQMKWLYFASFSAVFSPLHSITSKEHYNKL